MEKIQGLTRLLPVPHLPTGRVVLAAAAKSAAQTLEALGVRVLSPVPHPPLPAEICEHTDLLLCPTENGVFLAPGQPALRTALTDAGIPVFDASPVGGAYPADIPLNILSGRDFVLGNLPYTDPALLQALRSAGKTPRRVKQGYTKCAVCPVTETAYITDDAGIAAALRERGKNVLEIEKGDVYLSGAHFGFFGGAAGLIAPDRLAVNGSLRFHRDGGRIRAFLRDNGVEPVELHTGRITDIGGIVPLLQTAPPSDL